MTVLTRQLVPADCYVQNNVFDCSIRVHWFSIVVGHIKHLGGIGLALAAPPLVYHLI